MSRVRAKIGRAARIRAQETAEKRLAPVRRSLKPIEILDEESVDRP